MYPGHKSYLFNPGTVAAPPAATSAAYTNTANNPGYSRCISAPPPDYEQRVPSGITSISHPATALHHHNHRNYNESSGFPGAAPATAAATAYPKHKSYLTSTLISIPKSSASSSSYYSSAPPPTTVQEFPGRYSLDSNIPPVAATYIPPKFLENKSLQKMNCFPKQRFTPYTGRLMTAGPQPPLSMPLSTNYSTVAPPPPPPPDVISSVQRVPCNPSYSYNGRHSLNTSASYIHNRSLNVSASSFKSDLDSSGGGGGVGGSGSTDFPEASSSLATMAGKMEANMSVSSSASSSSLANLSAGSYSGGSSRNDSGIGGLGMDLQKKVMLQLNNLDSSYDESALKKFLISLLKPITPIVSLLIDGASSAKIEVPSPHFAKSVISQLHRKKIGRKRMLVSYCKETINDISTLGYQVAGLLKDVPFYTLPLNKFRELFQARFKASISVLELYKMVEVCHIQTDENEEKHIHLNQAFLAKIEDSPFNPNLQHSIPYCARHFKRENYKGWAEQELEPLPHVFLTISQVQSIVYRLMQSHTDGIPVASILHCIEACLNVVISANENGVSLEHLLSCARGVQIENNVYGIKIIGLKTPSAGAATKRSESNAPVVDIYDAGDALFYSSSNFTLTPAQALAKEVIELLKICPKACMNFSKFVPAYHNYFGKQCRVADYGYTKLIELFEGMSSIIQVLGEGNNRYITLTHRIQVRRFSNDLMKTIKWQVNKSILLSKLPHLLAFTMNHTFSITDYGVCSLNDMLEELETNGAIIMDRLAMGSGQDVLISLPKHKQTRHEIEKMFIFAGEVVELLRHLPYYEILFQKFVKSYFYHFGYHCRWNEYGFQKLTELFETIEGLIMLDPSNDENRKINLSPVLARRIFSEQLNEIVGLYSRRKGIRVPLVDVVNLFRNKFGYSMIPQTLGCNTIDEMMRCLPFVEINESEKDFFIICHGADEEFRKKSLMVCLLFIHLETDSILYSEFFPLFYHKFNEYLTEAYILAMKHVIEIHVSNGVQIVVLSELIKFILWVVCQMDPKSPTTIKFLKSELNIQINSCFALGYPNLSSLLAAFPEIFSLHGRPHENAEVLIQPQFFITRADIQKYFQTLMKQADQLVPPAAGQAGKPVQSLMSYQVATVDYALTESTAPRLSSLPMDPSMASLYSQPEINPTAARGGQQSMSMVAKSFVRDVPVSSRIVPTDRPPKIISKLIRGVKRDFIPLTIRSNLYEPPKPDTPPTKVWPFGYDPIWSEDLCSPPIDMAQFKLPITSPAKMPVLLTPAHIKIPAYTLFDFDAAYREMM